MENQIPFLGYLTYFQIAAYSGLIIVKKMTKKLKCDL